MVRREIMRQKPQTDVQRMTRDISRLAVFVNDRKEDRKIIKDKSKKDSAIKK